MSAGRSSAPLLYSIVTLTFQHAAARLFNPKRRPREELRLLGRVGGAEFGFKGISSSREIKEHGESAKALEVWHRHRHYSCRGALGSHLRVSAKQDLLRDCE